MKILFVHNRYQHLGGEDAVVDAEMNLMARNGHDVSFSCEDNTAIVSFASKVKTFLDVAYSVKYKKWMYEQISAHNPDVVHVHNFFPLLSPSIYDSCLELKVPVVQTLHNYRTICPGALLMRNGAICESCITSTPFTAVLHRCYRESAIGTLAVARMVDKHRKRNTWNNKVNAFIALTEFSRSKFIAAGFPEDKIIVKPNFVADYHSRNCNETGERNGALFVGRLSIEKGVSTLIKSWKGFDLSLRIAGTGPLDNVHNEYANESIVMLGGIDQNSVRKELSRATFLVMPSEWYETFGLVIIEAFSQGTPVLASRLGAMSEIVEDGITGLHFEAGNSVDLAQKVQWMNEHPDECLEMGKNARKVYQEKYTPEINYEMLLDIYQQAIEDARSNH